MKKFFMCLIGLMMSSPAMAVGFDVHEHGPLAQIENLGIVHHHPQPPPPKPRPERRAPKAYVAPVVAVAIVVCVTTIILVDMSQRRDPHHAH